MEGSPKAARKILRFLLRRSQRETLAGDFEEMFLEISAGSGRAEACRWYWKQLLKSIPGIIAGSIAHAAAMGTSYLRIALRSMSRQKVFASINVFGLATGLTCFILIGLYASFELGFDRFHHEPGKVFRVASVDKRWMNMNSSEHAASHMALGELVRDEFPEVTAVTRFYRSSDWLVEAGDRRYYEGDIISADEGFFDVFDFAMASGTAAGFGDDPFKLLLTRSMAMKYFGDTHPVGRTIRLRDMQDFEVVGVLEDPRGDSHIRYSFVIPLTAREKMTGMDISSWRSLGYTYLRLADASQASAVLERLNELPERLYRGDESLRERAAIRYSLQPLTSIHLHSRLNFELSPGGSLQTVTIAFSIALLILLIACVNYVNLSTARAASRSREVGVRKVIGANRGQLVQQFIGEAFAYTLVAFAVSILLVTLLVPQLSHFTGREISSEGMLEPRFLLLLAGLYIFVSLVSGAYPAFVISSSRPAEIFHYSFSMKRGSVPLRSLLIVFQFAVSVFLVICTLAVRGQLDYIKRRDMGFSRDRIISATLRGRSDMSAVAGLKARLAGSPAIEAVTASSHLPSNVDFQTRAHWPGMDDENVVMMNFLMTDYDFARVFGLTLVDGRDFSREYPSDASGAFLLNEKAVSLLGWDAPVGKEFDEWMCGDGMKTGRITGVVKDFNNLSLHHPIEPLFILLPGRYDNPRLPLARYVSVRFREGHAREAADVLEAGLREFFPGQPPEYRFFDEIAAEAYESERKAGGLLAASTVIALVIACVGLFGLILFTTEQRTKEIGIRKTLGASGLDIVLMLTRGLAGLVAVAVVLAWPLAWIAVERWMRSFEYSAGIDYWSFPAAGAAAVLLMMVTIGAQALKAAGTRPVDCLRYE